MEVNISIDPEFMGKVAKRRLINIAERVLQAEKVGDNIELGILITDQDTVQELNRKYRGKDRPTDVLAFFMISGENADFVTPPDKMKHLGEVIISYPQAVIQARENHHPVSAEITVLLIHGILHLLGYDHERNGDAHKMHAREDEILKTNL